MQLPETQLVRYDRRRHGIHNLFRTDVIADPRLFADAVAELGSVYFDAVSRVWVCTGYDECIAVLSDSEVFSSARPHSATRLSDRGLGAVADVSRVLSMQMLFADQPAHGVLRGCLAKEFTPAAVRRQDAVLRQIVSEVLHGVQQDARTQIDVIADFAGKLPTRLVAELLHMHDFENELPDWAEAYEKLIGSLSTLPHIKDQSILPVLERARSVLLSTARTRLTVPGDDLVSRLVAGLHGLVDDPIEVAAANCLVMMAGGYQTLTQLVAGGLMLLSQHPDQMELLRSDPSLIDSAVNEIMRINGSSQYVARRATTDTTLAGQRITAGQTVIVMLAAANLDVRKFTDPKVFDIRRNQGRHLGFGRGRHYCLGAPHAERLGGLALLGFLRTFPEFRLSEGSDAVVWGPHANTRCPAKLIVDVAAQRPASMPLRAWNDTDAPLGPITRWHEVFEAHAATAPDHPAVDAHGGTYTYRHLDECANAVAWTLRERGVEPGTVVGVCMDRSVGMIVAVLAIAKAGGAFMLADAACPPERLAVMVEEAGVSVMLSDTSTAPKVLAAGCEAVVFGLTASSRSAPVTGVHSGDTAYVVFTSGTTGRPKGIAISHEGVVNLNRAHRDVFRPGPSDRVLQFLSPNFDGCVYEITMALMCGATLVVEQAVRLTAGPPLLRVLRDRGITIVTLTPSVWAALPSADLPDLRIAAAAGEKLPAATVSRWLRPGRRFLNLYGPAEAAVWTTWHDCDGTDTDPPIGRPVANKRVYVLDDDGRTVPVGVDGELCISGIGIGRYLHRPELMERVFVRDRQPDARVGHTVLYRTGDRCRWRADGVLEYRGRRDRQAKIRGQRVELDEVERILAAVPGVRACTVTIAENRLVAVVVADQWDERLAKEYLAARLHSAMVPAQFTVVEEIPRTLNGKSALPDAAAGAPPVAAPEASITEVGPVDDRRPEGATALPPQHLTATHLTWRISQLFAACLQIPQHQVKHDTDFFDAGGDSLTVAEFLTGLEREAAVALDVELMLNGPTPARIAELVTAKSKELITL
jgi:amino acid adenylation domain-containing protein